MMGRGLLPAVVGNDRVYGGGGMLVSLKKFYRMHDGRWLVRKMQDVILL